MIKATNYKNNFLIKEFLIAVVSPYIGLGSVPQVCS